MTTLGYRGHGGGQTALFRATAMTLLGRYPRWHWDLYAERGGVRVWMVSATGEIRESRVRRTAEAVMADLEKAGR